MQLCNRLLMIIIINGRKMLLHGDIGVIKPGLKLTIFTYMYMDISRKTRFYRKLILPGQTLLSVYTYTNCRVCPSSRVESYFGGAKKAGQTRLPGLENCGYTMKKSSVYSPRGVSRELGERVHTRYLYYITHP